MLLHDVRPRRRGILRHVLLAVTGAAITAGGGLVLNFDVLLLGTGCLVVGILGIRRRDEPERQPWSG